MAASEPPFKPNMISDRFAARTRASDWAWAEQAMNLGFNGYTLLSKDMCWAESAAANDKKNGARIAMRLMQDLVEVIEVDHQRAGVDAFNKVRSCLSRAVTYGNVALLNALGAKIGEWDPIILTQMVRFTPNGVAILPVVNAALQPPSSEQPERHRQPWNLVVEQLVLNDVLNVSQKDLDLPPQDGTASHWLAAWDGYDSKRWNMTEQPSDLGSRLATLLKSTKDSAEVVRIVNLVRHTAPHASAIEPSSNVLGAWLVAESSPQEWNDTSEVRVQKGRLVERIATFVTGWGLAAGEPLPTRAVVQGRSMDVLEHLMGWDQQLRQRGAGPWTTIADRLHPTLLQWEQDSLQQAAGHDLEGSVARARL